MRRYRVLMLAPTSFFADYGCHVRILEEATTLRQMGHQVKVCTYHTGRDVPGLSIVRTARLPWRRESEIGPSYHRIALDLLLFLKTLVVARRWEPDIIHAHLHEGALIGYPASLACRAPLIFDFQGSMTSEMIDHGFLRANAPSYVFMSRLEKMINRLPKATIVASRHAFELLARDLDNGHSKIHLVPDCIDARTFAPNHGEVQKSQMKRRLGIPPGSKVVVYLGLLAEHQGTTLLMQSLRQLLASRSDVHTVIMGYPSVEHYQAVAGELGIDRKVTFTGRIPYSEAHQYLSAGDVAVSPKVSATEGQGKLLTYMAMGIPTVAFDTPVAREYLDQWGIFARFGDPLSLAEAIAFALDNPDEAIRLGSKLRERAISHYSWEAAGRKIVEIYDACHPESS